MSKVSIFGLGLMGRPMALRLIQHGFIVQGWNRTTLNSWTTKGIPIAPSLAEAAKAEICLLMLADSLAVDAVLEQLEPLLKPGQVVLDMGSSDPARSKQHAARLAERDIGWVDAPVSGGPEGVVAGSLAIMAGGERKHLHIVYPLLDALGSNVTHVGGPGAGHTVKVINQLIVALTIEAVAEALTLAEASGVEPRLVQEALRGGFADSKILQLHGGRMIARSYTPGGRSVTQLKDLRLAQALAEAGGLDLPHLDDTAARFAQLVSEGHGGLDHSALHLLLQSQLRKAELP
jgi:2-hydroxy-3-oxopropionate reductase